MNPQQIIAILSALPWNQLVTVVVAALKSVDASATNPVEKILLETSIGVLERIVPPAPGA